MPTARQTIEFAFTSQPTSSTQSYADYTPWLREPSQGATALSFQRGRQQELQRHNTGQCSFTLDNRHRTFSNATNANVKADRRVRVSVEYPWLPGLLQNGGFDAPTLAPWTVNATVGAAVQRWESDRLNPDQTKVYDSGGGSVQVTLTGTDGKLLESESVRAVAGSIYYGSGRFQGVGSASGIEQTSFRIAFFSDTSGTVLIAETLTITQHVTNAPPFVKIGGSVTAPAGTQSMRVRIYYTTSNFNDKYWIDSIVLDGPFSNAAALGIFPEFVGFIDEMNQHMDVQDSTVQGQASDAFKVLGFIPLGLGTAFSDYVISKSPALYWRFQDGPWADGSPIGDSSGNNIYGIAGLSQAGNARPTMEYTTSPLLNDAADTAALGNSDPSGGSTTGLINCVSFVQGTINRTYLQAWRWTELPAADTRFFSHGYAMGLQANGYLFWENFGPIYTRFNTLIPLVDSRWHLIMMSVTGAGVVNIYVDGALVVTDSSLALSSVVGQPSIQFGADLAKPFRAEFDEVAIFSSVLSPTDATTLAGFMHWDPQTSGNRIATVLDSIGWPGTGTLVGTDRNIDTGLTTVQGAYVPLGQPTALEYLQQIEVTEAGQLFIDRSGRVRFIGRDSLQLGAYATVQATFGTAPGELPFSDVVLRYDDGFIINHVTASCDSTQQDYNAVSSKVYPADDLTSRSDFFIRGPQASYTGLLYNNEGDALQLGYWVIDHYKTQNVRIESMTIEPLNNDLLWTRVNLMEIGDRVQVNVRWPGGSVDSYIAQIQGIHKEVSKTSQKYTYLLGNAEVKLYTVFDDATRGLFDGTFPMAF